MSYKGKLEQWETLSFKLSSLGGTSLPSRRAEGGERAGCSSAGGTGELAGNTHFNHVVRSSVLVEVLDSHRQLVSGLTSYKVLAD